MPSSFDPKRVLRQTSNHLLEDLLQVHGHELDVPWHDLRETQIDVVFDAWQELPTHDRRAIEIVLHEVSDMATEDGVRAIIEEAKEQGNEELVEDIAGYDSRYDKAVWTYIKARDVWDAAVRFARADSLSRGRYWIKRADIPSNEPDTGAEVMAELEHALSAFFVASQGRGHVCKIEHHLRADGSDYFFAYLDDYADTYINFDAEGEFARTPERRAFELVFVYNRRYGTLEMFARGGKKVNEPLQEIFCRVILGEELGPEDQHSHPYDLNGLLRRGFEFPTDPEDGIESVRVRKLRLTIKGMPRRRITIEADPEAGPDDVYDMMERYLDEANIPASIMNVTQVGLKFTFDRQEDSGRQRSLSFEVSYPNLSNLKSKPDRLREMGEKYLRQWGVDRAADLERAIKAA